MSRHDIVDRVRADMRWVVPAALVGGFAAVVLMQVMTRDNLLTVGAVLVMVLGPVLVIAAVAVGVAVVAHLQARQEPLRGEVRPPPPTPPLPAPLPDTRRPQHERGQSDGTGRGPSESQAPEQHSEVEPSVDVDTLALRPWWERDQQRNGSMATKAVRAGRSSPPSVRSAARVVQCPNCGNHKLDVALDDQTFTFTCRRVSCGQRPWRWTRGQPWPTTSVVYRPAGRRN